MRVLIVTGWLLLAGYFFYKPIRKYANVFYVLSLVVGVASVLLMDSVEVTEMLIQAYVGTAFLYIVMITGIFKKKSKMSKRFMSIRKEYSILGFLALLPHVYVYIFDLFEDLTNIGDWIGVIAFLIMVPLFITSFTSIRKKYSYAVWKKIQRWAYLVYAMIYVHILFTAATGDLVIYSVLFIPYFIIKVIIEYQTYKTKQTK